MQPIQPLKAEFAALPEQVAARTTEPLLHTADCSVRSTRALRSLQKQCAPVAEKRIMSRSCAGRHKVHLGMVVAEGAVPVNWRTCCGFKYAFWACTRHRNVAAFPEDTLCEKCSGRRQLSSSSPTREISDVESETVSSSSSGSQVTCHSLCVQETLGLSRPQKKGWTGSGCVPRRRAPPRESADRAWGRWCAPRAPPRGSAASLRSRFAVNTIHVLIFQGPFGA